MLIPTIQISDCIVGLRLVLVFLDPEGNILETLKSSRDPALYEDNSVGTDFLLRLIVPRMARVPLAEDVTVSPMDLFGGFIFIDKPQFQIPIVPFGNKVLLVRQKTYDTNHDLLLLLPHRFGFRCHPTNMAEVGKRL